MEIVQDSIHSVHFPVISTEPRSSPFHPLHSEWTDQSPIKISQMSYSKTYETPVKSKTEDKKLDEEDTPVGHKLELSHDGQLKKATVVTGSSHASGGSILTKKVSNSDIFWSMLNDVVGKDKMAKFSQYTLRLLIYWATKSEAYLSEPNLNISTINTRYNDREKKLNLMYNFFKHPQNFVKIVCILVLNVFQQRFAGMVKGLGLYRQFLRFGKSPFRFINIAKRLQTSMRKSSSLEQFSANFLANNTLDELIGLYYNINDEGSLLFKLNMLSNKPLHNFVSKHEAYAWYADTINGLYKTYFALQDIYQKEMEVKIQMQVKSRSRIISKQLLGSNEAIPPITSDDRDMIKLKEIQFAKKNLYLDMYKLISDFIFNSYTVFNAKLPFDTLQIWMGISASFLSCIKLYRQTKKRLEAE